MKIVRMTAENVKRLVAVEIAPDGSLVVVGGKNGAGKTSLLDSIQLAMGGKKHADPKMLREGTEKGSVILDLGDIVVRRTLLASGGGQLVVENQDGARYQSPQTLLDGLVGKLSFDPLAFSRAKSDEQLAMLKALVGLDFTEHDRQRKALYDERTEINRSTKACEARLATMPPLDEDAPAEEVSVSELARDLEEANAAASEKAELLAEAARKADEAARRSEHAANSTDEIEEVKRRAAERIAEIERECEARCAELRQMAEADQADAASLRAAGEELVARANEIAVPDREALHAEIEGADAANATVRANAARRQEESSAATLRGRSEELTRKIEEIDAIKSAAVSNAEFPVPGLGFDDLGVTFNNLPFAQASSAEQLRVSVAMGLAMNPTLKILLIRDGSLLDEDSLAVVAAMAEESEAQVWMERVGEGDECSVIIEDGSVKGTRKDSA